jgi:hypothetical protein
MFYKVSGSFVAMAASLAWHCRKYRCPDERYPK